MVRQALSYVHECVPRACVVHNFALINNREAMRRQEILPHPCLSARYDPVLSLIKSALFSVLLITLHGSFHSRNAVVLRDKKEEKIIFDNKYIKRRGHSRRSRLADSKYLRCTAVSLQLNWLRRVSTTEYVWISLGLINIKEIEREKKHRKGRDFFLLR